MSAHIDIKSESVERTRSPSPRAPIRKTRRETIFEREDIVKGLTPASIAAIQKELVELHEEFEERLREVEHRADRMVREVLQQASDERIDMVKLRIAAGVDYEEGTGSTARSRSSKGE